MKVRVRTTTKTADEDLQSQPSTSTNPKQHHIQPIMKKSGLETNSLTTSLWTNSMISGDSNTPSDVAFYRRASWLEEYAMHRLRSIEDRSEAKRQEAVTSRKSGLGDFLTSCLPCSNRKKVALQKKRKSIAFSSQTSLTSMLEKAEEEDRRMSQVQCGNESNDRERPRQRVVMITSSL